jgi:signal transduction histidine kinase
VLSVLGTVAAVLTAGFSSLVAVAFAGNAATAAGGTQAWAILGMLVGLLGAAALVWRARYPLPICLATSAAALLLPLDAFAPLLALTWVIARRPRAQAWGAGVAVAAATAMSLWRDEAREGDAVIFSSTNQAGDTTYLTTAGYVVLGVLLLGVAVAAGLARRYAGHAHRAAGVAAEQTRTAQALRTELSRQEEREAIAREMHDTVAHHLSLVSLHAAALEVTAGDPATDVPAAARSMREAAHRALEEMRTLVASLRDATEAPEPGTAPALAELPRLVGDARDAGADVTATLYVADEAQAPPALARAVYRIVQESLTNVLKHAPGERVEIDVRAARGPGVDVVVRNRMPAVPPADAGSPLAGAGGGAGLLGMSERARALGGTFEAGAADGWFAVRAHLPWSAPGAMGDDVGGRL